MPIGQLLASITGEKTATPKLTHPPGSSNGIAVKRNADEDGRGSALKFPRTTPASAGASNSNGNAHQATRPYAGSARPSSSNASRPTSERPITSTSKKPALVPVAKPSPTSASFSGSARSTPVSSLAKRTTPPATTLLATPDSTKAPKKGSIAEIRARAAAQQARLQGIGKIQHKATEKPALKRDREDAAAAEEAKTHKKVLRPGLKSGPGGLLSRAGPGGPQRNGNGNGSGHLDRVRGAIQKPDSGKTAKDLLEVRKVKKAALATTGYQGSAARPAAGKEKPSVSRLGAPGAGRGPNRGREKRPNPMGMFSKPRRQQDEDYDEDMDDFVVDDEEDEVDPGYRGRYRYADEDDDSDMEAGFSDVEDEESAAAKAARLEDMREEKILEKRKREKEARRREALKNRR